MKRFGILGLILIGTTVATAQPEPSPEMREVLAKIASDSRLKDIQQYANAMKPAASLKQKIIDQGRVPDLNYIYGWNVSADGKWPVERANDLVFEVVLSRRYNESVFLKALETGAPFLRQLRESDCLEGFNTRYRTSIPQAEGLSFPQAENFLYSVVGAPGFDADRVLSDLCTRTTPAREVTKPLRGLAETTATVEEGTKTRNLRFVIVIVGGIVPLAIVVLLVRSLRRDLRKKNGVALVCVLSLVATRCGNAVEEPARPNPPAAVQDAVTGELPSAMRRRIQSYKDLASRGRYSEAIAQMREVLPNLERFVERNPTAADAQNELAGAYTLWMFVAATKLPPGQEATRALVEGTEKDYIGRAVQALDAFEKYCKPDDPRRHAAAEVRRMLDDIRTRANRESPTPACADELLRLCRRVEEGEAPAKVFGVQVSEMIEKAEACTACGTFPRIESEVIPAARKMREVLEQLRKERQ